MACNETHTGFRRFDSSLLSVLSFFCLQKKGTRLRYQRTVYGIEYRVLEPKKYGLWAFLFDAVLTVVTSGLWLIWVFVREMRRS